MEKGVVFGPKVSEKGVLLSLENLDGLPNARISGGTGHMSE